MDNDWLPNKYAEVGDLCKCRRDARDQFIDGRLDDNLLPESWILLLEYHGAIMIDCELDNYWKAWHFKSERVIGIQTKDIVEIIGHED